MEGIFSLNPFAKRWAKSQSSIFQPKFSCIEKIKDSDLALFFEDGTYVKIASEIKLHFTMHNGNRFFFYYYYCCNLKFTFSEKATKIDKIFTFNLTVCK